MQADESEVCGWLIRPPVSSIAHFFKSPPPQAFPKQLCTFTSTIPTDARIPRQPPLLDVSINLAVSAAFYFRVITRLYPNLSLPACTVDDLRSSTHPINIPNTPTNRSLLHHAIYGIITHPASEPPSIIPDVLAANLHALSRTLATVPAFVISLEPSPYFGIAGLEARIVLSPAAPTTSPLSYHLLGISAPEVHIPNLQFLLHEICPNYKHRLLGVISNLTPEQHNSPLGVNVSRTIAHFMRLAPRAPFVTPDMTLSPPPLTPAKLAALTKGDLTTLVNQYRPRLEHTWSPSTFDAIVKENEQLRESHKASHSGGEAMLEHAWALVGDQYPSLRKFVAVLATAFVYKPPIRTKVPISCQDATDPTFAAEFVLQARQFALLRKLLVA